MSVIPLFGRQSAPSVWSPDRYPFSKARREQIASGTSPLNQFNCSRRIMRPEILSKDDGIGPVNAFDSKFNSTRDGEGETLSCISPRKLLEERFTNLTPRCSLRKKTGKLSERENHNIKQEGENTHYTSGGKGPSSPFSWTCKVLSQGQGISGS